MQGDLPRDISDSGKAPPPERFANAGEVQTVCNAMIAADDKRAEWRASITNLWAGHPTYPLHVLKAAGQGWRARTNHRELEGIVSSEQTLDFDLEMETDAAIDIDLDYGEGQDQKDWADCIEQHFTWLLRQRNDDYAAFHVPFRIFQKLLHGMGAQIWPHGKSWIPRTPRAGCVLFPEDTPTNFAEDGDYFMLRDFQPAHAIYRFIANEKAARDLGWNPDAVWKALAQSSNKNAASNPEELARAMQAGDIGASTRQSGLWLNHLFVREFESQKISQYIIAEKVDAGDYLFKSRDRFDEWPLVTFPYDIGNGTMQSVRGLGARTKDFFELSNRIKNAMADQVQISSYPQIKQMVQNIDPDKLKLMKMGAMSILPYGVEPSLIQYPHLDNGPLALSRELHATMLFNNRGGMSGQEVEPSDRMTGQEYAMRSQNSAKLNNGSVVLHRSNLRRSYEKMLRLAVKETSGNEPWAKMAREFRELCARDGVPVEAFKHIVEVRANVNSGKGSAAAQLHSLMTLVQSPVYANASEEGKIALERDLVANLFGYTNVGRYARSIHDQDMPDNDESFATLENAALIAGGEALATSKQDHVKHLQRHLQKAGELVQAFQGGEMDPQQAYSAIAAIGEHCAQHLQLLQSNKYREAEFKELQKQWTALAGIADKLAKQIQDEQSDEEPSPEQQLSEQGQIGMMKVQQDAELKQAKAAADEERKNRKQAVNEQLAARKLMFGMRINDLKTAADVRRKSAVPVNGARK